MKLVNYISDLLYRYDCVIVPNFGGFITNKIGASINNDTHTFSPPTKQISFNTNLKHNDGLLANYIASVENISFEKANAFINTTVLKWGTILEFEAIEIGSVGSLVLNEEKHLVFEPNTSINFLTTSFGLTSITFPETSRFKAVVKPLIPVNTAVEDTSKRTIPTFIKVAATVAVLLTVGTFGIKQYTQSQKATEFAKQQEKVEQKIQSATFVIDNPLPTINLKGSKVVRSKEFHVVAGAFQLTKNARRKVNQLLADGFNARVLGLNKWGLTQVVFESYETRELAVEALEAVKKTGFSDAWLLIKKVD